METLKKGMNELSDLQPCQRRYHQYQLVAMLTVVIKLIIMKVEGDRHNTKRTHQAENKWRSSLEKCGSCSYFWEKSALFQVDLSWIVWVKAYSVKTVSSMPKLGHMLVICRSRSSSCLTWGRFGRLWSLTWAHVTRCDKWKRLCQVSRRYLDMNNATWQVEVGIRRHEWYF